MEENKLVEDQLLELEARLKWREQFVQMYDAQARYWYRELKKLQQEITILKDSINKILLDERLRR